MASSNFQNAAGPPMYKNRLQEFTQKSNLPLPVYRNVNEGFPHAPKFRSSVVINDTTFTSSRTFSDRRAAEQDVAKTAYESVTRNSRNQDQILVRQACQNPRLSFGLKPIFCKSILHEYAIKVNLGLPKYNTTYAEAGSSRPVFISSFELGGKTYKGEEAKSLKEAEQLAARIAIQTLLRSDKCGRLAEIVKSKERLYSQSQAKNQPNCQESMSKTLVLQHQPNKPPANFSRQEPSTQARNQPTQFKMINKEFIGNDSDLGKVIDPRPGVKRKFKFNNLEKRKNARN